MENQTKLFTSFPIGKLEIKNRMIMTAMHTGFSIDRETAFLAKRAAGGAGAVTAVMGVSKVGAHDNMCVLEEAILPDLARMAKAVQEAGGKLFIQLFHAGRNGNTGKLAGPGASPIAPSPISSPIYREVPKEMTLDDIGAVVDQFGKAALICKAAGVDAVEISCSAGYLLSEFLSPLSNRREDRYGGSLENRMRFPLEVVREVRRAVGNEYPVIFRLSGSDMLGGYGIGLTVRLASEAERYVDAINVTGGWHESKVPQISMHVPEGGFAFLAGEVKKAVAIPVIACNRINNRATAEEILHRGLSDFVGCARSFLIDPEYGNKIMAGRKYRKCIGCNGCITKVLKGEQVACAFNPGAGFEGPGSVNAEGRGTERRAAKTFLSGEKKILVIGGGPAGMEGALRFGREGCCVRLCTEEDDLGGLLKYAAKAPYKAAIGNNIEAMEQELIDAGAEILTRTAVDGAYVDAYHPDLVVVATGSRPFIPPIEGAHKKHVYTAQEILAGEEGWLESILSGNVLIVGGGAVGLETALYLVEKTYFETHSRSFVERYSDREIAEDLRCAPGITVVEMNDKLGLDLGSSRRIMLNELERCQVQLLSSTRVEEILDHEAVISTDGDGVRRKINADTVILAAGYQSVGQELIQWLIENEYEFKIIGDARKVGTISRALEEAYV